MPRIFISYRRQDSSNFTGRIHDSLVRKFGDRNVFRDVYDIPAGSDFRTVLDKELSQCDIFLAIIGPQWVSITDSQGNPRLDDPNDFVRIEVESTLNNPKTLVIPVLVDNASMPAEEDLPKSLRELCYRNAVKVRTDPDFPRDIESLIRQISPSKIPQNTQRLLPILTLTIILIAGTLLFPTIKGLLEKTIFKEPETSSTVVIPGPISIVPTARNADGVTMPNSGTGLEEIIGYDAHWDYDQISIRLEMGETPVSGGILYELPDEIDPSIDPEESLTMIIDNMKATGFDPNWPHISPNFHLSVDLFNIQEAGGIEIKIENEAETRIISYDSPKSHVNAYFISELTPVTGGGSYNLKFSPIYFNSQGWASQEFVTILNEYDYISIGPGKFEGIEFEFICSDLGIYKLETKIKIAYIGEFSTIDIVSPELSCPESFTLWTIHSEEILNLGEFVIEDGQYIPIP